MQRSRQQRVDSIPPEFVLARTHVTPRLVKCHYGYFARHHPATIHLDVIPGLDAGGQFRAGTAIHIDAAGLNQCVTGAAGADGTGCEVFIEAGSVVHGGEAWNAKGAEPGRIRARSN